MFGRKVYNRCPVDDEPLAICELDGIEVDLCTKCGGVWLDRGELDLIATRAGGRTFESIIEALSRSGRLSERKCPRCVRKMLTIETAGPQIECCPRNDGYWLDGGELEALLEHFGEKTGGFLSEMLLFSLEKRRFKTDRQDRET